MEPCSEVPRCGGLEAAEDSSGSREKTGERRRENRLLGAAAWKRLLCRWRYTCLFRRMVVGLWPVSSEVADRLVSSRGD
ncbi:unnamed protein product [Heligmosomoides polygyrus]|uniref:Uncharacterized protein n=1 Tax=Heligmosomoides polygyrus TaxID=6339 RepID=A0A3P8E436_HELPZ|nr:unnamed protein product [Heligmosomoides polygyrus]